MRYYTFVMTILFLYSLVVNPTASGLGGLRTSIFLLSVIVFFTVRRYALHGLSYRNSVRMSVRPSVCLSHSWTVSTWFDLRS